MLYSYAVFKLEPPKTYLRSLSAKPQVLNLAIVAIPQYYDVKHNLDVVPR